MATVSKDIADKVVKGKGFYPGDRTKVVKIVQYENIFDRGLAYGLIYKGEPLNRYDKAGYNPKTYWEEK